VQFLDCPATVKSDPLNNIFSRGGFLTRKLSHIFFIIFFSNNIFSNEDSIVITADRISSNEKKSSSSITLISNKEIKESKANDLLDLLKQKTDVTITQAGQTGSTSSLFLRGAEASHTIFLLDGIILNDPSNPNRQFDLSKINLNNIDKIEILKGSQGLLYGSNAIGGVVVISSKKTTSNNTELSTSFGTFNTSTIGLNQNLVFDKIKLNGGFQILKSDGFSVANDPSHNNDLDGIKKISFNLGLNTKIDNFNNYDARLFFSNEKINLDKGGGSGADDPNYSGNNQSIFAKISNHIIWNDFVDSHLQLSYTNYLRRSYDNSDPYQTYDGSSFSRGTLLDINIENKIYYTELTTFDVAFGRQNEQDSKNKIANYFLFTYGKTEISNITLNSGIRIDHHELFQNNLTYKFGVSKNISDYNLHSSVSSGFRAPSLNQLFDKTYGNKNLSPEKSKSFDIGIKKQASNSLVELNLFYTHLENRLSYHPTTFINQNFGRSYAKGIEFFHSLLFSENLEHSFKANLLKAIDLTNGNRLARRPELTLVESLKINLDKYSVRSEISFKGSTADVDNSGNKTKNNAYSNLNFYLTFAYQKTTDISLIIKNVANSNYEDIWGYNNGGRDITLRADLIF
jgi:vitamin B12 transporter